MSETHEVNITEAYVSLRSIYVGAQALRAGRLKSGQVAVLYEDDESFSVEGRLNESGSLSGMAKLYHKLGLVTGSKLTFEVTEDGSINITQFSNPTEPIDTPTEPEGQPRESVFKRLSLEHIHVEPFRPENLNKWEPQTEADVYLAFGVLQEYTDFQYCCGASSALLDKLGYDYKIRSKPDAVLVSRINDEYQMAEWKMRSSDFKQNHKPEDVDVLVCWTDDEKDREILPPKVLTLRGIAKEAAEAFLKSL